MYRAKGILRVGYLPFKIFAEVDPAIANYYRSLIPKYLSVNKPRYAPHISVVRKEKVEEKYEGVIDSLENQTIDFWYDGQIIVGKTYVWLNVMSLDLETLRLRMGLRMHSEITRPPEGFKQCFHITIGNFK